MAASSALAETLQPSMSIQEAVSSAIKSLPGTASALPSVSALTNSTVTAIENASVRTSWIGILGNMALFSIKVFPGVLYWIITFTTITIPTFLFTLFSTSLTFTMNATTL